MYLRVSKLCIEILNAQRYVIFKWEQMILLWTVVVNPAQNSARVSAFRLHKNFYGWR